MLRRVPRRAVAGQLVDKIANGARLGMGENGRGTQCALNRRAGKKRPTAIGSEGGDVQAFNGRIVPVRRAGSVFERYPSPGEVLREAAP